MRVLATRPCSEPARQERAQDLRQKTRYTAAALPERARQALHRGLRDEELFDERAHIVFAEWVQPDAIRRPRANESVVQVAQRARVTRFDVFAVAEDQEQVDKALEVKDRLPNLTKIIYVEPRGVRSYDDPMLMSWEVFLGMGRAALAESSGKIDELVDGIDPEAVGTLVYTSGTTGPPKGAMISHRNILSVMEMQNEVNQGYESDEILSFLPLCHIAQRGVSVFNQMLSGWTPSNLQGGHGILDPNGDAQATLYGHPALAPAIGRTVYLAAVSYDAASLTGRLSSIARYLTIVP